MKNRKMFICGILALALLGALAAPCRADYGFEPSKAPGYGFSDNKCSTGYGFPAAPQAPASQSGQAAYPTTSGYGNYYYYYNPEFQQYYFKNYNPQGMMTTTAPPKSILDPGYTNQQSSIFTPQSTRQQSSVCSPQYIQQQQNATFTIFGRPGR
ncbi:MAG: hypothetical protein RDV48_24415 [Candidatus Eremiobacteraeota bacterium]|nr:hypothetical protein [Candidatus Eremiobacteraeota bacterium]